MLKAKAKEQEDRAKKLALVEKQRAVEHKRIEEENRNFWRMKQRGKKES